MPSVIFSEVLQSDRQIASGSLRRVPLEVKRFVGSPKFDENGTMWMDTTDPEARWPENLRFTGDLTDEVDENWNEIVEDRYFSVSEAEAIEAWGDRRHEYVDEELGGYTAGLDVFHTLHCLVSSQDLVGITFRRALEVNLKTEQSAESDLSRPLRPRVVRRNAKSAS